MLGRGLSRAVGGRIDALGVADLSVLLTEDRILMAQTAFADDPTDETLSAMAVRVESAVRTAHPELTEEAVRAIGNYYSFCWK